MQNNRVFALVLAACAIAAPLSAQDSRDIDAVSRSVVRVIVISGDSASDTGVGMGSGVAVTPNRIVTNAHVVASAVQDDGFVGIVPSEGRKRYEGRIIAYRPDIDLAVIDIGNGRIPPATLYSGIVGDGSSIAALGYPYGVDRALASGMDQLVAPQSPVKSLGHVAGRRNNGAVDTVLHDANIGRGNSGGPLVDACGRVVGINSFLSVSDGIDSTFAFAVAVRELVPLLKGAGVEPAMVSTPCVSDSEASARAAALSKADENAAAIEANRGAKTEARAAQEKQGIRDEILGERENAIALATLLLVLGSLGISAGFVLLTTGKRITRKQRAAVAGAAGAVLMLVAVLVFFGPSKLSEADDRYAARHPATPVAPPSAAASDGAKICVLVPERSRVTVSKTDDVPLSWQDGGCVNGRTQYGSNAGTWSRAFVPNEEPTVTVQSYDPTKARYTVERYLMAAEAMDAARKVRARYTGKGCAIDPAARRAVSDMEAAIRQTLPPSPNERLVFDCRPGKPQ